MICSHNRPKHQPLSKRTDREAPLALSSYALRKVPLLGNAESAGPYGIQGASGTSICACGGLAMHQHSPGVAFLMQGMYRRGLMLLVVVKVADLSEACGVGTEVCCTHC